MTIKTEDPRKNTKKTNITQKIQKQTVFTRLRDFIKKIGKRYIVSIVNLYFYRLTSFG